MALFLAIILIIFVQPFYNTSKEHPYRDVINSYEMMDVPTTFIMPWAPAFSTKQPSTHIFNAENEQSV